ncbi:putative diflavin flavoprotein A [Trichinella spiralis]|uniref:Diflavin flavoprotein A n=1 Tax=Trichinella spiralis TaxID=6334 RepID=A0ABR3KTX5_TRISP
MVLGSLKPKPLAGFVFRGRLGMFEYFRSLNLVDKFAHTSVNSAPSKRESSLSKFHFSDIGRFAGRQQTSTIQANVIITNLELVISRLATMMIALPVSGCGQRRKRRTGAILVLISPAVGAVVGMIDGRHGRKRKKRTPRFVTVHRNDPRERYCSHSVKCVVRNSA